MVLVKCDGFRHEPETGYCYCPYGYSPHDDESWEDMCDDCVRDVDEWAVLSKSQLDKQEERGMVHDEWEPSCPAT